MTAGVNLRSYVVSIKFKDVGYMAPVCYSDLALAYKHFLERLSGYEGEVSTVKLYCLGEFDPGSGISSYSEPFEVTDSVVNKSDLFDKYIYEIAKKYFDDNPNSPYQISVKDVEDFQKKAGGSIA